MGMNVVHTWVYRSTKQGPQDPEHHLKDTGGQCMDTFKTNIYFSNEITFPMSLFYYNYTTEAETFCHTTNNARTSGS